MPLSCTTFVHHVHTGMVRGDLQFIDMLARSRSLYRDLISCNILRDCNPHHQLGYVDEHGVVRMLWVVGVFRVRLARLLACQQLAAGLHPRLHRRRRYG